MNWDYAGSEESNDLWANLAVMRIINNHEVLNETDGNKLNIDYVVRVVGVGVSTGKPWLLSYRLYTR